jgi:hypothetical protein
MGRREWAMPVTDPNMPEPLKQAIEEMERSVQETSSESRLQAPEMQDKFWITLQMDWPTR